jgi:hypothetical protein
MPTPPVELEQGLDTPDAVPLPKDVPTGDKVTLGMLAIVSSAFTVLLAWALKRRSKENNAEDWAWSANQTTIKRLEQELLAARTENDGLRSQRNEYDAGLTRAKAECEIASNAARAAREALERVTTDYDNLRHGWEKSQRYVYILRAKLAENNIEIPLEPVA